MRNIFEGLGYHEIKIRRDFNFAGSDLCHSLRENEIVIQTVISHQSKADK